MTTKLKTAGRTLFANGPETPPVLQFLFALTVLALGVQLTIRSFDWIAAELAQNHTVLRALSATGITALATALGATPVIALRAVSARAQDTMLGFGAGVMLAASAFSLIMPGLAAGEAVTESRWLAGVIVASGIVAGAAVLAAFDRWLPHEHFIKGVEGAPSAALRRIWLFIFAITLHNVPEGLAVGVGLSQDDAAKGVALATGIAIQNLPEGLVVAAALRTLAYSRFAAVGVAAATGLAEPLGGLCGAWLFGLSQPLLPFGLAFAAGAMLFVVSHEIIPESHRNGHEARATAGVIVGFVLMMLLDTMLAVS